MIHLRQAFLAASLVLAPAVAGAAVVSYVPPSGALPAQQLRGRPFDAVLPSGRIVTPAGTSVVTGANALAAALTPDARFAIVGNDDPHGSLAVVDLATMRVVDRYAAAEGERFWLGVVALRDPAQPARTLVLASGGPAKSVYAFTLDANGHIAPDAQHVIPVGGVPGTIALAADGRHAYVLDEVGGAVATIDLATRSVAGTPQPVGYFPFGAALAGDRLLVTNEGLMRYAPLPQPAILPSFAPLPADLARASSLSLLAIGQNGALETNAAQHVPMDPTPNGIVNVGGAHPEAIVTAPGGAYAYVAMANVDRIATVALGAAPHVVGGTELRLFDRGPYGTQPAALALSKDGSRLYVALAGLNAVAVVDARDPIHLHRLGLIPTGWDPTALALSPDDRTLYVLNTKGFGHDHAAADAAGVAPVASTLEKIDLAAIRLSDATLTALKNTRRVVSAASKYPPAVRNVVVILSGRESFDAILGDLGPPHGDPALVAPTAAASPNVHALARRYGLAANYFSDADEPEAATQFATSGIATLYTQRTLVARTGRLPFADANEDPEDAARAGSIFNALVRHRLSFRDYGVLLDVAGDENGTYTSDVPAAAVLAGHVDPAYPGPSAALPDRRRAEEFRRDYAALARGGRAPRYAMVALPGSDAADRDRALGEIVQTISHLPSWRTTAIFVIPDGGGATRDHVGPDRGYALVVSPYAKRGYVGMRHLSTASVLKTSEQILRLGTLSLGDLLANDLSDFFTTRPNLAPYTALTAERHTGAANRDGL